MNERERAVAPPPARPAALSALLAFAAEKAEAARFAFALLGQREAKAPLKKRTRKAWALLHP
jgi:hypothetical protein